MRWSFLIVLEPAHIDRWYYYVDGWTQDNGSNDPYYWKPDSYDMPKTITELDEDRNGGKAGAHRRLESFRKKRIYLVEHRLSGEL